MSDINNIRNDQSSNQMNDLMNSLEVKLSQRNKSSRMLPNNLSNNFRYSNYNPQTMNNYMNKYPSYNNNNNQNNLIINNNQLTNYELRKIIKEEFFSLYKPYIMEEINQNINRIRNEINNIYQSNIELNLKDIKNDRYENEKILKDIKNSLYNFVPLKEYNKKIYELEEKINFINSQNNKNNFPGNNLIKSINEEMQEIKNKNEELNIKLNNFIKNNNEKNEEKINYELNQLKLKDFLSKNSSFQKDLEKMKEDMDSLQSKIRSIDNNKKLYEIESKIDSLTNYENKYNKINNDLNKVKESVKSLNKANEEIKNSNYLQNYNINNNNNFSINDNYENKIYKILDKLNLRNLDINKFNELCKGYEIIKNNYLKISKVLSSQNTIIIDLAKKFKNNNNYILKDDNNINTSTDIKTDIILLNKKNEFFDRQIQYLQSQLERLSIDVMKVNNNNNDNNVKKESILLIQKEIEKMKMGNVEYNNSIEKEKRKREENTDRINKIESELKEEKKLKIEEKINMGLELNRIKFNEEKIKKLEEEITKISEEKFKQLKDEILAKVNEDKIFRLEFDKINKNKNEENEKAIKSYEGQIYQLKEEVIKIGEDFRKFEEEKNAKFEKEKTRRIEDENRMQLNEEKIRKIEEDIKRLLQTGNNKDNNNDEKFRKIEEEIRKIKDEKIIDIQKDIIKLEEIINDQKQNNENKNEENEKIKKLEEENRRIKEEKRRIEEEEEKRRIKEEEEKRRMEEEEEKRRIKEEEEKRRIEEEKKRREEEEEKKNEEKVDIKYNAPIPKESIIKDQNNEDYDDYDVAEDDK